MIAARRVSTSRMMRRCESTLSSESAWGRLGEKRGPFEVGMDWLIFLKQIQEFVAVPAYLEIPDGSIAESGQVASHRIVLRPDALPAPPAPGGTCWAGGMCARLRTSTISCRRTRTVEAASTAGPETIQRSRGAGNSQRDSGV